MVQQDNVGEEAIIKASILERRLQEIAEKIGYIAEQMLELEELKTGIDLLSNSKEKNMLSSVGRGIYVKSSLPEETNNLFVNVGAGVIMKKTPEETIKIIEAQLGQFKETKEILLSQLELYKGVFSDILSKAENKHNH